MTTSTAATAKTTSRVATGPTTTSAARRPRTTSTSTPGSRESPRTSARGSPPGEGADTLDGVEALSGTINDDVFTGDGNANILLLQSGAGGDIGSGGGGADILVGQSGKQTLGGEAGNDPIIGSADGDVLSGGPDDDSLNGGPGDDTGDYSSSGAGVTVDLSNGAAQATGQGTDTLSGIDNLIGTSQTDVLTGDGAVNTINAGDGTDDIVRGLAGNDVLDGGGDAGDTVSYVDEPAVLANLTTGTATNTGGTDTLSGFFDIDGSLFDDTLVGDGLANELEGFVGDDALEGRLGDDAYDGGGGARAVATPRASRSSALPITVDLGAPDPQTTGDGGDTFLSIENLSGSPQGDSLTGDGGPNRLSGAVGNDNLFGLGADDNLLGGAGSDAFDGGAGSNDRALFTESGTGVSVSLASTSPTTGTANEGGADTITGVENITGSEFQDALTGNNQRNLIDAGDGGDTIGGVTPFGDGGGDDVFDGGPGAGDAVSYQDAPDTFDAVFNIPAGTVTGDGTTDTMSSIDFYAGGDGDDQFTGDGGTQFFEGRDGNDTAIGAGGADFFDGGPGDDTLSYADAASGASVNLETQTVADDGDGASDTLFGGFESVIGSPNDDQITGSDGTVNNIQGGLGNDTISGRTGNDTLNGQGGSADRVDYQSAAVPVTVDLGNAAAQNTGDGSDTLSGFENLTGSNQGDTLTGTGQANSISALAGNDSVRGAGGVDSLDGGNDTDTVTYSSAAGSVTANLGPGTVSNDGDGASDTLVSFENLTGSENADNLTGSPVANVINALGGNDTLELRDSGPDVADCGAGTDRASTDASDTNLTACERVDGPGGTAPPQITGSDPGSGGNDNSPRIQGSAPAGSTVTLYASADCSGAAIAAGSVAEFGAGFQITVADNSTTTVSARAADGDQDGDSACSDCATSTSSRRRATRRPQATRPPPTPRSPSSSRRPRIRPRPTSSAQPSRTRASSAPSTRATSPRASRRRP